MSIVLLTRQPTHIRQHGRRGEIVRIVRMYRIEQRVVEGQSRGELETACSALLPKQGRDLHVLTDGLTRSAHIVWPLTNVYSWFLRGRLVSVSPGS